jgi:hypothetical protein
MKTIHFLFALSLVSLTACSTAASRGKDYPSKTDPETVLVTYRMKPGKDAELQDVLARAWAVYRKGNLVFARPHVIIRDKDSGSNIRYVEIFTWVSHSVPEHAPDTVKTIWDEEQSLCEPRAGHLGIELGEVDLVGATERW